MLQHFLSPNRHPTAATRGPRETRTVTVLSNHSREGLTPVGGSLDFSGRHSGPCSVRGLSQPTVLLSGFDVFKSHVDN